MNVDANTLCAPTAAAGMASLLLTHWASVGHCVELKGMISGCVGVTERGEEEGFKERVATDAPVTSVGV